MPQVERRIYGVAFGIDLGAELLWRSFEADLLEQAGVSQTLGQGYWR